MVTTARNPPPMTKKRNRGRERIEAATPVSAPSAAPFHGPAPATTTPIAT